MKNKSKRLTILKFLETSKMSNHLRTCLYNIFQDNKTLNYMDELNVDFLKKQRNFGAKKLTELAKIYPELIGFKYNNGWISVSENDLLPKPGTNVFIVKDGEISKRVWTVDYLDRLISETSFSTETILKTQITHYKILEFPTEKPVY